MLVSGIGRAAYEAYADQRGWVTFDNKAMLKWAELGDAIQAGWDAAGRAGAKYALRDITVADTD
jgi:hypothetical protein